MTLAVAYELVQRVDGRPTAKVRIRTFPRAVKRYSTGLGRPQ